MNGRENIKDKAFICDIPCSEPVVKLADALKLFNEFEGELETILNQIKHTKDIDIARLKIISLKTKLV